MSPIILLVPTMRPASCRNWRRFLLRCPTVVWNFDIVGLVDSRAPSLSWNGNVVVLRPVVAFEVDVEELVIYTNVNPPLTPYQGVRKRGDDYCTFRHDLTTAFYALLHGCCTKL